MRGRRYVGRRRIRSHASSIRPLVIVPQALVVLAGCKWKDVLSIHHDDKARLLAVEAFLDHDPGAAFVVLDRNFIAGEHGVDGGMRLLRRACDDDALSRRQAVGLDDDRRAAPIDVGVGGLPIAEAFMASGRNAMPRHELLREMLGAFEPGRGACRTENSQPRRAKRIDNARGERGFGPHDGQSHLLALRKCHQIGYR